MNIFLCDMLFLEQGKIGTENGKAWVESLTSYNLFTTDKQAPQLEGWGACSFLLGKKQHSPRLSHKIAVCLKHRETTNRSTGWDLVLF